MTPGTLHEGARNEELIQLFWKSQLKDAMLQSLSLDFRSVAGSWQTASALVEMLFVLCKNLNENTMIEYKLPDQLINLAARFVSSLRETNQSQDGESQLQHLFNLLVGLCEGKPHFAAACINHPMVLNLLLSDSDDVREELLAFVVDNLEAHDDLAFLISEEAADQLVHELAFTIIKCGFECCQLATKAFTLLLKRRAQLAKRSTRSFPSLTSFTDILFLPRLIAYNYLLH